MVRVPMGRSASGGRLYHNKTIHGTKKDAEKYLARALHERDSGTFVQDSRTLLRDFMTAWLDGPVKQRVRPRTLGDYTALATRYVLPALGHRGLSQLCPAEIQAFYAELTAKSLSPRTIRYIHSVLHGTLEQAVRWGMLSRNPAKLVDLPRLERAPLRSLSLADATRLMDAMKGTRWEPLWALLLTTGLRPGEALALQWTDIDGDRIRVQKCLVRNKGGGYSLPEPKTSRARRVVTLPDAMVRMLEAHRERQRDERSALGKEWSMADFVFSTSAGEPLDFRTTAARYFRPVVKSLGLEGVRPYDLRHTSATLLLAAGENVKVVSERLGHSTSSLTLDVYTHVLPDMQQQASLRLQSMLFG